MPLLEEKGRLGLISPIETLFLLSEGRMRGRDERSE